MQEKLNSSNYPALLAKHEIREQVTWERHANPLKSGQPFCTYSQMLSWFDAEDDELVRLHRYLLPNSAELGASKKPDPVRLKMEGKIYKLRSRNQ